MIIPVAPGTAIFGHLLMAFMKMAGIKVGLFS